MTGPKKTRREFIRSLGRTTALSAVVGGGILLAAKSASRECEETTPCKKCKLLGRCDLPEAQAQRNE